MDQHTSTGGSHLSSAELAGYLDHAAVDTDREKIEAHLALCDRCLEDMLGVVRVLRRHGRAHSAEAWGAVK
jgi:hypothetical protein